LLQVFKRAAQLAVDVIDDASPSRAWILIGWNDLIADRGESPGFIQRKKSPRSSVRAASDTRPCCGGERRLQEGTPVEFEAGFHFSFVTCGGAEVCDQHHERVWAALSQVDPEISGPSSGV
jgi:hypothetical protein